MEDSPSEKDVIKWQYVEHYYPYMIEKLRLIDQAIQFGNQMVAFTEMNTLFIHINNAISTEQNQIFQEMIALKNEIRKDINILTYLQMSDHHGKIKIRQTSKIMTELNAKIDKFYMLLMGTMDKLNMFFPRDKKSMSSPLYQN